MNLIYLALLCAHFSLIQYWNFGIQSPHIIYYSKAMCLTDIPAKVNVNDMFLYVEESWQLETYLIRKGPIAITGNSTHHAWGSALLSHSNILTHTLGNHKVLFSYKNQYIYKLHLDNYIWFYCQRKGNKE